MRDQDGMYAITAAVASLAEDPYPAEGFHRGDWHRLRVGEYRVLYAVEADYRGLLGLMAHAWPGG